MKHKAPYIYIVDDNTVSLKILQKKIRKAIHCNIRTFTTAEECLRTINLRLPDLVLADYYLDTEYKRIMNGDDLLCILKKRHPALPVIIYSSTDSIKLVVQLIKDGAQDFIPRNENFIPEITKIAAQQIKQKKTSTNYRSTLLKWLIIVVLLITGYFILSQYKTEWLSYFIVLSILALIITTICLKQRSQSPVRYKPKN